MRQKNGISYNISRNGSAGDWYWEVISDRKIIERGLAPTSTQARAEAIKVAASYLSGSQGIRPLRESAEAP
jgi:hypothetical protein